MRALTLWVLFAAAIVQTCKAALIHRGGAHKERSSSIVGDVRRNAGLLRKSSLPISDNLDATLRSQSQVEKFGPGNCIATWRNEDGHCELETKCEDHDISQYAVKFICIDDGGEKVRHVFAVGSFDAEEQFDTLIECKKCLAEKEETIQVVEDVKAKKKSKDTKTTNSTKKEEKEEEAKGSPVEELRKQVKSLEEFMMNTSDELKKLNAKVYEEGFKAKAPPSNLVSNLPKPVNPDAKAATSLVHHGTSHLRIEAEAARAKKAHRRHLKKEADGEEDATTISKVEVNGKPSLVGALETAEVRDDEVPAQQPARKAMVLRKKALLQDQESASESASERREKHIADTRSHDDDETYEFADETSIPADEVEHQEDAEKNEKVDRPAVSALQRGEDDDNDENDENEETVANDEDQDNLDQANGDEDQDGSDSDSSE